VLGEKVSLVHCNHAPESCCPALDEMHHKSTPAMKQEYLSKTEPFVRLGAFSHYLHAEFSAARLSENLPENKNNNMRKAYK